VQGIKGPYDPRSSIMAGSWYLNHVFELAAIKNPELSYKRSDLDSWKKALRNYYLGPAHEKLLKGKFIIYPNGQIVKIEDAETYVGKVMMLAKAVN